MKERIIYFLLFCLLFATGFSQEVQKDTILPQLIPDLKNFIHNDLGLKTEPDFYSTWAESESKNYYLYISYSYTIGKPDTFPVFRHFGFEKDSALQAAEFYQSRGFHTLVYGTAGTSAAKLNHRLLTYPQEDICFILIHEAMHQNLKGAHIPYEMEEAICDLAGNYGTLEFARKGFLDPEIALDMLKRNEKLCSLVEKYSHRVLRNEQRSHEADFQSCRRRIGKILTKGDPFIKDRFDYKVNNAYFLRNRFYTKYYHEFLRMKRKIPELKEFLNWASKMPSRYPQALELLRFYIRKVE